jgi:anaerobic magnesium-protoporphyrin IX monomethyl ester cyclase
VTHINIVDDNFSFYPAYAIAFCEMVLAEPKLAGMTFATPNGLRVERSTPEMFTIMQRAGWSRVIFAPESGSQRMVDIMAKGMRLEVVPERVAWAHAAGLEVEAFFIMNYPGETDEDVTATGQFIQDVPFDEISLHIFKPLPHTPIWRELVEAGGLAPDYVVGRYDEIDWLANGRSQDDIEQMVRYYRQYAKGIYRVA